MEYIRNIIYHENHYGEVMAEQVKEESATYVPMVYVSIAIFCYHHWTVTF